MGIDIYPGRRLVHLASIQQIHLDHPNPVTIGAIPRLHIRHALGQLVTALRARCSLARFGNLRVLRFYRQFVGKFLIMVFSYMLPLLYISLFL